MLGPLSRVMMIRQPFCAKNMQNLDSLCATFSTARTVPYFQLTWALLWSNRTAQRFNITAGVQKLCHRMCWDTIAPQVCRYYGTARWFYRTLRCHSSWTPAVVLNRCAVLLDHNNAWFSCKYRTARAGLNFAQKSVKSACILHKMAVWPSSLYSGGPTSLSEAMSYVKCTIPLNKLLSPVVSR